MPDIRLEEAKEYLTLAQRALDRHAIANALNYCREAESRLLRMQAADIEPAGSVIGESTRVGHLGKVLAEKARLR